MSPFFTIDFWKDQYGNMASVVGLVISLVGFFITIVGVTKAKNSAEQAKEISNNLLHQLGTRLFLGNIGEAIRLLNDLRADCRSKSWERAIYHGEHLQRLLISLIESPYLIQVEQTQITSAIDDLTLLLRRIESDIDKSKTTQLTSAHKRFFGIYQNSSST
ncbi:hypothetical protein ACN28I_38715 [Archangium gephyra]|uniref:hypothetical protein n=1 Tax=Archangium gephyra TaxID=48 RepID=UPI003B7E7E8D